MKYQELLKLTKKDRKDKLKELKMELVKARVTKTPSKIGQIKKIIARINTIKNKEESLKKVSLGDKR